MYQLTIHSLAKEDVKRIASWYNQEKPQPGFLFLDHMDSLFEKLE
jgi:hypothetical protein